MFDEPTYQRDIEFYKLLARRSDIDLTTAALELARDAYPLFDFSEVFKWLEERGRELSSTVARTRDERAALDAIVQCIAVNHGIFGDEAAFQNPDSSYLHRVIESRRGIPISLSLLYMAVGAQVGLELHGVSAPRHFIARYESASGPLFVDAFARGQIRDYDEAVAWIRKLASLTKAEAEFALRPAGARVVVIRMLNNLKVLYTQFENWPLAWQVQHRLCALQPASHQERRDLAVIAMRGGRPGKAINLLESCVSQGSDDEKPALHALLEHARRLLAQNN